MNEFKFWVVCRPSENSVLEDIFFETTAHGLIRQAHGGLMEQDLICAYPQDQEEAAMAHAMSLLPAGFKTKKGQ